jgi:hypothetical protein
LDEYTVEFPSEEEEDEDVEEEEHHIPLAKSLSEDISLKLSLKRKRQSEVSIGPREQKFYARASKSNRYTTFHIEDFAAYKAMEAGLQSPQSGP